MSNRSGTFDVYVTSPDGGELIRLTNDAANESAPFWTRDDRVVFSVWADNASTVYSASARATAPTVIGKAAGRSPIIAPDGKKLIYSSGQYPSMQLEEAALDGSNVRQLTKGPSRAIQRGLFAGPVADRVCARRLDAPAPGLGDER